MLTKNTKRALILAAAVIVTVSPSLRADDVTGADRILCASIEATRCDLDGCVTQMGARWVPRSHLLICGAE